MKRRTTHFVALVALVLGLVCPAARAADAPPRLSIELRDGSVIVGASPEENLQFHSPLFGDFKVGFQNIRSIDCVSTNSVTLSTIAGDSLTVSFSDPVLKVKTGFGQVELPVNSIRRLIVTGTAFEKHSPGLVALWSGDNRGKDSAGTNDLTWTDISYANGKIGQAFVLNGDSTCAEIPSNPTLDVGRGDGLTLSAWIKPSDVSGFHPIMEWNTGTSAPGTIIGVQLWIGQYPNSEGVLSANFVSPSGDYIQVPSYPNALAADSWQHVAVTYDKRSGIISLYLNGNLLSQRFWGNFDALTTGTLWISARPTDHPGDWTYHKFFDGMMDQIAIYNRALSPGEIKSICAGDNNGEPMPPNPHGPTMGHGPYHPIYQYNIPNIDRSPVNLPVRSYPSGGPGGG